MKKPVIGIVSALASEGRILLGRGRWQRCGGHILRCVDLPAGARALGVRCGPGFENALAAGRFLNSLNVSAIIGLGLAGGISPAARPGDLIVADTVLEIEDDRIRQIRQRAADRAAPLRAALMSHDLAVRSGTLVSTQRPVLSAGDKAFLFRTTEAFAVDMESAALAAAALEANIPFLAVRAVCDPAETTVRRELHESIDGSGRFQPLFFLGRLVRSPLLACDLLKMARRYRAAGIALRRSWQVMSREPALLKQLTRKP